MTHNCYFRLTTTTIGVNVTDTWLLMHHHGLFPALVRNRYTTTESRKVPIKAFAGILSGQLLHIAGELESIESVRLRRRDEDGIGGELDSVAEDADVMEVGEDEQFATFDNGKGNVITRCIIIKDFQDGDGRIHRVAKFPVVTSATNGRKRGIVKQCDTCSKLTTCFCTCCMKPLCYSFTNKHTRTCFIDHIPHRRSVRITHV